MPRKTRAAARAAPKECIHQTAGRLEEEHLEAAIAAERDRSIAELRLELDAVCRRNGTIFDALCDRINTMPELEKLATMRVFQSRLDPLLNLFLSHVSRPSVPSLTGSPLSPDSTSGAEGLRPISEALFG